MAEILIVGIALIAGAVFARLWRGSLPRTAVASRPAVRYFSQQGHTQSNVREVMWLIQCVSCLL